MNYILMGKKRNLQLQVFQSKCSKEEGGQGHSLEEACLNFSEADRNIQAVLAKGKVLLLVLCLHGG